MTNIKLLLPAVCVAAALSACGSAQSPSPEATVKKFYSALQDENATAMAKLMECPAEALTGMVMAKAFGMDVSELAKGSKVAGPTVFSDGGAKAEVPTTGPFGDDTQKLVKINAKGNLAPANGTWKIACEAK